MVTTRPDRSAAFALVGASGMLLIAWVTLAISTDLATAVAMVESIFTSSDGTRGFYILWAGTSLAGVAIAGAYLLGAARNRLGARVLFALCVALVAICVFAGFWLMAIMFAVATPFAYKCRNGT